jgi:hypothetical protein
LFTIRPANPGPEQVEIPQEEKEVVENGKQA